MKCAILVTDTKNESGKYQIENYMSQQLGLFAGYFTRMLSLKEYDYVLVGAPHKQIFFYQRMVGHFL